MPGKIIRVEHGHDGQRGLVVEVGKAPPAHYKRRTGRVVSIEDGAPHQPLRCILDDGDVILIGRDRVSNITRE